MKRRNLKFLICLIAAAALAVSALSPESELRKGDGTRIGMLDLKFSGHGVAVSWLVNPFRPEGRTHTPFGVQLIRDGQRVHLASCLPPRNLILPPPAPVLPAAMPARMDSPHDTLQISYAFLIFAPAGLWILCRALRGMWANRHVSARSSAGRCVSCGYDLRATPARCPECGTAATTAVAAENVLRDLFNRGWSRRCFIFTACLMGWAGAVLVALALAKLHL